MHITESQDYVRVFQALGARYALLIQQPSPQGLDDLLQSLEHHVAEDVNGILTSLRQMRTSSRYLRQLGSARFRPGRGRKIDDLILYHNTAALHEAGTLRNRVIRMMAHYRAHIAKLEEPERLDIADNLRQGLLDAWRSLQKMRDNHVHEIAFVPADVATNPRSTARRLASMWENLAEVMEDMATFTLELASLLSIPTTEDKEFERVFRRIESRLHVVKNTSGRSN